MFNAKQLELNAEPKIKVLNDITEWKLYPKILTSKILNTDYLLQKILNFSKNHYHLEKKVSLNGRNVKITPKHHSPTKKML